MSFSSDVKKELLDKHCNEKNKASSFLRDAFVSYGTMTDPEKCYHLEFSVVDKALADNIIKHISKIQKTKIGTGISVRNGSYVIYMKSCENITDFLTYIGATSSAMKIMQIRMVKDLRNHVNRTTNFETANLDKTVRASDTHMRAIKKIQETVGLDSLPENLREVAELRIKNPEISLKMLGEKLEEPISKSGINHRLKKIMHIAENL